MKTYWLLGNHGMCSLINLEESNSPVSGNETNKAVPNSTLHLPGQEKEIKGTVMSIYLCICKICIIYRISCFMLS